MILVDELSASQWKSHAAEAHAVVFGKRLLPDSVRIDFALVVRNDDQLMGYVTCREVDADTLYWQFGGAFPGTLATSLSWRGYQAFVDHCKCRYKRITTFIENTNLVMLKMAMKVGYRIVGIRTFNGEILLEHLLEFGA